MDKNVEQIQNQTQTQKQTEPLVHDFKTDSIKSAFTPKVIGILIGIVVVGVLSGYLISQRNTISSGTVTTGTVTSSSTITVGEMFGTNDVSSFKDTAEGTLQAGGIDGEGAYHLVRPGGDSQNVYLTSSTVDLSKFIGRKIKVWGATQAAQHAGWLMDVGRIQVES